MNKPAGQAIGGRKMQDNLRTLREQWKLTDQGGMPNHGLWKRFDEACNEAYKVVEAWLEKTRAESELISVKSQNLETEIQFKISGRVEGLSDRATTTIEVLNLGDHEKHNKKLIEKRKQFSDTLLWTNGIDPDEGLEDDQLLEMLINDLVQSQQGQMMEPFTPVVINILRSWLSQTKKI